MARVTVVGSGASGVHFALTLLRKGHEVTLLDFGRTGPVPTLPERRFEELKATLRDPVGYFLGPDFEAVVFPGAEGEYYAFPPGKRHVFEGAAAFRFDARDFAPLFSFGRGGLAEAWTAGVYPFNDAELEDFPFSYRDIEPYYAEAARRIGVNGEADDLARFHPVHDHLLPPLELDAHSGALLAEYARRRDRLNRDVGCHLGRSRIAALTRARGARPACTYCGRCLWGCPTGAFYTPSITLEECRAYPGFRYVGGVYVSRFRYDARRRVTAVVVRPVAGGGEEEHAVGHLVLAAGTLGSSRIFLESILRGSGERVRLAGLMDNQQILVPFVNLRLLGRAVDRDAYQYHQVAFALEAERPKELVHAQITTLTTALYHPLIQRMPVDLGTAAFLFRNVRAALGMVNVNLHDTRRDGSYLELETDGAGSPPRLAIRYEPDPRDPERIRSAIRRTRRALRALGCIVPPGMTHVRPKGASVHYAGTVPMSRSASPLTTDELGRSRDFENLYFADGTTFPFLPAKNITFTLMANAIRIAENAF